MFFRKRGTRVPTSETHTASFLCNIGHLLVREPMARQMHVTSV
jgi:hypothetical protein